LQVEGYAVGLLRESKLCYYLEFSAYENEHSGSGIGVLCSTYTRAAWLVQVRVVLEGADKFNNLIGSVHFEDVDSLLDLSLELVKHVSSARCESGFRFL
jgi:hypothetical protein